MPRGGHDGTAQTGQLRRYGDPTSRVGLVGGDWCPLAALLGGRIGLTGGVRRRQAEPAKSRARQLDGTAGGGQGEETDEDSRNGDSSHAMSGFLVCDSIANKRGQTLKATTVAAKIAWIDLAASAALAAVPAPCIVYTS